MTVSELKRLNSFSIKITLKSDLISFDDWGSGGWISWDQNRRLNDLAIMRSTGFWIFHEIEIPNNDLISWSRHFTWDQNSKKHY